MARFTLPRDVYFGENAMENLKNLKGKNKELLIVKDASHVDLYDNLDKIPFAKISEFFKQNLN